MVDAATIENTELSQDNVLRLVPSIVGGSETFTVQITDASGHSVCERKKLQPAQRKLTIGFSSMVSCKRHRRDRPTGDRDPHDATSRRWKKNQVLYPDETGFSILSMTRREIHNRLSEPDRNIAWSDGRFRTNYGHTIAR